MTRNRILLLILWILSLIGISYFGGPISYGFFAVITLIPVVSLLYILLVFFRFKIYQRPDSRNLVAEHISKFYITLQNEDLFTFSGIRIQFYSPFSTIGDIDEQAEYELMPKSGIRKETTLRCRYRGEYEVGVKSIIIRDFFCLFRITYRNKEPYRVNVFPQIVHLDVLHTVEDTLASSLDSYKNSSELDATVRDYAVGDELRRIHWKAVARQGKLLSRDTIGEEKQGIGILLDPVRYSDTPAKYLPAENKLSELVLALAMYFTQNRSMVRFYSYPGHYTEQLIRDTNDFGAFYESFARFRFEKDVSTGMLLQSLLENDSFLTNRMLFLVIQEWNEDISRIALYLTQNMISVIIYLVTDDRDTADFARQSATVPLYVFASDADLKEVL